MDENAFNELTANTDKRYDASLRQVSNGFALSGNVRYLTPGTEIVRVAQTVEAIATTADAAAESLRNFLNTGSFKS